MDQKEELLRRRIAAKYGLDPAENIYEGPILPEDIPAEPIVTTPSPTIVDRLTKGYETATTPLVNLEEYRSKAEPSDTIGNTLTKAAKNLGLDLASGATTPLNIAGLASGGMGRLGVPIARTIAKGLIPTIGAQMVGETVGNAPLTYQGIKEAIQNPTPENLQPAIESGVGSVAGLVLGSGLLRQPFKRPAIKPPVTDTISGKDLPGYQPTTATSDVIKPPAFSPIGGSDVVPKLEVADMPEVGLVKNANKLTKYPKGQPTINTVEGTVKTTGETPIKITDPIQQTLLNEAVKPDSGRIIPESRIPSELTAGIRLPFAETTAPANAELSIPARLRLAEERTPGSRRLPVTTSDLPSSGKVFKQPAPGQLFENTPAEINANLLKSIQDAMQKRQIVSGESGAVNLKILEDILNKGKVSFREYFKSAREAGVPPVIAIDSYRKTAADFVKSLPKEKTKLSDISVLDKIISKGGIYEQAGRAAKAANYKANEIAVPYINRAARTLQKVSIEDHNRLFDILAEENRAGKYKNVSEVPENLRDAWNEVHNMFTDIVKNEVHPRKMPIGGENRMLQMKEGYFPSMVSPYVWETLAKGGKAADMIRSKWQKYLEETYGMSPEKAANEVNKITTSSDAKGNKTINFKALSEPQTLGLPKELMDTQVERVIQRYFSRAGRHIAWFDYVKKNPDVAKFFGEEFDPWGNRYKSKEVSRRGEDLVKSFHEEYSRENALYDRGTRGFIQLGNASVMGAASGFRDVVSALQLGPVHVGAKNIPKLLVHQFTKLTQAYENAIKTGQIRINLNSRNILFDSAAKIGERAGALAGMIHSVSGKQLGEIVSRSFAQAMGEFNYKYLVETAKKNSARGKTAAKIIDEINPTGEVLNPEIGASRLASMLTGVYNTSTLPAFLTKASPLSFSMQLMRWSFEHARYFNKFVAAPMAHGDYAPILKYTVGALVGGTITKEILEAFKIKMQQRMPTFGELSAAGNKDIGKYAFNIATLATFNSYAGIYGDISRTLINLGVGENQNFWFQIPTFSIINNTLDTLADVLIGLTSSIDDTAKTKIIMTGIQNFGKQNNQMWRVINNMASSFSDEAQKKTDIRDKTAFEVATGARKALPRGRIVPTSLTDLNTKQFKRGSVSDAAKLAPEIIAGLRRNNPDPVDFYRAIRFVTMMPNMTLPSDMRVRQAYLNYLSRLGKNPSDYIQRYEQNQKDILQKQGMVYKNINP